MKEMSEAESKAYLEEIRKGWIIPEKIDRKLWDESLLPQSKFIEHFGYKGDKWMTRSEYVIDTCINQRMRISFEEGPFVYAYDMGRVSALHEQMIDVDKLDAEEFAAKLMETMFYHVSPYEMKYIVKALTKYLNDFDPDFLSAE